MVPAMQTLSADEARRVAVWAQGLSAGARPAPRRGPAAVGAVLRELGAVQLDTISVLARSHELVPYARLGTVGRPAVETAFWGEPPAAFEYWAHAACVLPIEWWPWFARRRRRNEDRQHPRRRTGEKTRAAVLAALRERGPLTATDLGGAKRGGYWWDWSDVKIAAEDLFRWGDVVVTRRTGWRRVYDLPERAIPAALRVAEPSDEECRTFLLDAAGRAMGVATAGDLAGYFADVSVAEARQHAEDAGLIPVDVEGWRQPAWAHAAALDALAAGAVPARSRTTLLSPFDSLVWIRPRVERVFGMRHRLEAYVPKPLREHGYFAMPVLAGGRLVARVDPARSGRTLVARHVSAPPGTQRALDRVARAVATALREAASWVDAEDIAVDRTTPAELATPLAAALAEVR